MFLEPGSSLFSLLVRHQYGCHYAWWCRLVSVLTDTIGGGYLGLSSLPATVHVLPGHSNIHSRPRPIKIETFFNIISTYPSVWAPYAPLNCPGWWYIKCKINEHLTNILHFSHPTLNDWGIVVWGKLSVSGDELSFKILPIFPQEIKYLKHNHSWIWKVLPNITGIIFTFYTRLSLWPSRLPFQDFCFCPAPEKNCRKSE